MQKEKKILLIVFSTIVVSLITLPTPQKAPWRSQEIELRKSSKQGREGQGLDSDMMAGHGLPVGLASVVLTLTRVILDWFDPHLHWLLSQELQSETSQSIGQSVGHHVSNSWSLGRLSLSQRLSLTGRLSPIRIHREPIREINGFLI